MYFKFVYDLPSIGLILSEEPSTKDRNVQLKPPMVGVGTLVDNFCKLVFPFIGLTIWIWILKHYVKFFNIMESNYYFVFNLVE